jgi:bifunctional DNA-binding transcriptional regulator/antitoxin component of YhaV-PrlF toxin-antitoxin module
MKQTTISKGGQVSIPAEIRHRWGTSRLLVDDRGHELAYRPLPSDPIGAARGMLRRNDEQRASEDARRRTRAEERRSTERPRGTR